MDDFELAIRNEKKKSLGRFDMRAEKQSENSSGLIINRFEIN